MSRFVHLKNTYDRILRTVDIFGHETNFLVFGEKKYTTQFGGMLSFLYFMFLVYMFLFLGSNMINRENPDITISQLFNENPTGSKIGKEDYFFIFGMQFPSNYSHFYDPSIYTVTLKDFRGILNFERCTEDHLPKSENLKDFFNTAHGSNLSELLCLNQDTNLTVRGDFALINEFNNMEISIAPCVNKSDDSSSVTCKPPEVIDEALRNGYFAYYSTDTIIDLLKKNPGQKVGLNYYIETDLTVRKQIIRFLSTTFVREDIGWIIKEEKDTQYTVMDRDRESMSLIKPEAEGKSEILNMVLRKSVYENFFTRKYMKIQSVLALMGGFLQIMYVFFYVISRPIIQKLFYDSVTNMIFTFENKDFKKMKRPSNRFRFSIIPKDFFQKQSTEEKKTDSLSDLLSKFYHANEKFISNYFSSKHSPLKVTFSEQINSVFTKNKTILSKTRQRNQAINKIERNLDLAFLLEKFTEIEKIKMLLLNEEQYRLFEFLPKPKIQSDLTINYSPQNETSEKIITNEKSFYFTQEHDKKQKAHKAEESLKRILLKENPSEIDLKLISLVSPDLKKMVLLCQQENERLIKRESAPVSHNYLKNSDNAEESPERK